jgi:hypothetical protein
LECSVKKAVLHILDSNAGMPVLSYSELEIENSGIEDFISRHVLKMSNDAAVKRGEFSEPENNAVFKAVKGFAHNEISFIDASIEISTYLFELMTKHVDILPADVLICTADIDGRTFFALLKLNYREGYTHYVESSDEGVQNRLIKHKTILPSETQKVDEGFLICLEDYSVRLLEKSYEINGEKVPYLSQLLLKCTTDISKKDTVRVIHKIAKEMNEKYYNDSFEKMTGFKAAVCEISEETGTVDIDTLARGIFKDSQEIQQEYVENVRKAGVYRAIPMEDTYVEKHFRTQKIKTDTGIELNFPSEMFNNKEMMEFINNPDGTISIVIKKVNKIISR